MICDHASGSSCSSSFIEPFTSTKRTVICLRSPSTAAFAWRIISMRSAAWAGDGVVVHPPIGQRRAAAAAEFLADLDRRAAGGTPHGQFGAALRAEATVGPVVVVTGRTAHWVSELFEIGLAELGQHHIDGIVAERLGAPLRREPAQPVGDLHGPHFCLSNSHSTGRSAGAPLSLIRNTTNLAGLVLLALRSTR